MTFLIFAPALLQADDITTQGWIDGPFFDLLGRFGDLYSSYTATAYSIGRILLMVDLGLMAIMWALNGGEVQKELNKRLLTIFIITAMMIWYPSHHDRGDEVCPKCRAGARKSSAERCAGDDAVQGRRPPEGLLRKG